MTLDAPVVVKLGGSLAASSRLPDLTAVIGWAAEAGQRIVVVPGGGPFADAVRLAQQSTPFDDAAAHDMALLAMAQYGRMLAALSSPSWHLAWGAASIEPMRSLPTIWLPDPSRDALDVERSWRVSADALALWLAGRIGARQVLLVKSCLPPAEGNLAALAAAGVVDAIYPEMALTRPDVCTSLVYSASAGTLQDVLVALRRL